MRHLRNPRRLAAPQHPIDGVEVEPLGIETPADADEHILVLLVLRVFDGGGDLLVTYPHCLNQASLCTTAPIGLSTASLATIASQWSGFKVKLMRRS